MMKAKTRIYSISLDSSIAERLINFEKSLNAHEEIVNTTASDGILIVVTEEPVKQKMPKNLLLEEAKRMERYTDFIPANPDATVTKSGIVQATNRDNLHKGHEKFLKEIRKRYRKQGKKQNVEQDVTASVHKKS